MCCTNMRTLSLIVGWIHLIFAFIMTIVFLIYLCTFDNETYDDTIVGVEVSRTGLPTVVFLFLFCLLSLIFDILLLKGISEERHKLMKPFVVGNYVALGMQLCLTIFNVLKDIMEGSTFGDVMIHLILNCVSLGIMAFFFYPIYQVYHQIRCYNEEREHRGIQNIESNAAAEQKLTEDQTQGMYVN